MCNAGRGKISPEGSRTADEVDGRSPDGVVCGGSSVEVAVSLAFFGGGGDWRMAVSPESPKSTRSRQHENVLL